MDNNFSGIGFSFKSYFIYILRKWFVAVACVALGLAVGVIYAVSYKPTNIKVYESSVTIDINQYFNAMRPENSSGLTEGDHLVINSKLNACLNMSVSSVIKWRTYEEIKEEAFPEISADKKMSAFYNQFSAWVSGTTLNVQFAYNIVNEEQDLIIVEKVINTYMDMAIVEMCNNDEVIARAVENDTSILKRSLVERNGAPTLFVDVRNTNYKRSVVDSAITGLAIGAVIGIVALSLLYILDRRIKRVADVLAPAKAKVFSDDNELVNDGTYVKMLTALDAEETKKLFVTAPITDENVTKFAQGFVDYAASVNRNVNLTVLGENGIPWRDKTQLPSSDDDALQVYAYVGEETGAISFIAQSVGKTMFIVDQAKVKSKTFTTAVSDLENAGGNYVGTVVYNLTKSYVG